MRDSVAEIPRSKLPRALAPALMADRVSPIKLTLSPDHFGYTKPYIFSKYFLNGQSPHPDIAKHTVASSFQNILISSTLQTEALGSRELLDYLSQNQGMETDYGNHLLYTSVQRIINAAGRLPDEIAEQFFHGISRFIPGISFARVQDGISRLPVAVPPIGFSMLLLAICLITFHQITPSSLTARPDQASLYTTTKLLFNQATKLTTQSPPAITLIQAGIIIAVYEYASGMPDTAFQSLSGCANMGYDANLHQWIKAHGEGQLWKEGVNTWWAILIYERLCFCEMTPSNKSLPFSATMPSIDFILPVEPNELDLIDPPHFRPASIGIPSRGEVGPQAWSAQGIRILDQIHQIMRMENSELQLIQLTEIDEKLQCFAMTIMSQRHKSHDIFCGSVAIVIRSLFLVNEHILAKSPRMIECGNAWWSARINKSNAALETATIMMIDIIDAESEDRSPGTCPPSRLYRLQAALEYLDRRPDLRRHILFQAAKRRLREKLDAVNSYWGVKLADS